MTADDQMTAHIATRPRDEARRRSRELARRAMWRLAPAYARQRTRRATASVTLQRLQDDLEHVSKRHTEQIERLEDLTRELVQTVEILRREIAERAPREGA
jgi:hypothetical protein